MFKSLIIHLIGCSIVCAIGIELNEHRSSKEETFQPVNGSTNKEYFKNGNAHLQTYGAVKGDTTVPPSNRFTSSRAYQDDRKRDNYRYYGTGSKSGNSFTPTNIHKSTSSLDSHNYFVTTKSHVKDLEAAGSGMASGSDSQNSYLTVYESPPVHNSGGNSASLLTMEEQFGDMVAESGHGGGYGSSHGGGGKGCNSALGLLGVLGLAAYLQNVLRNMNGTAGRKRRDVSFDDPFTLESKLEKVRLGMAQLDRVNLDSYLSPLNTTTENLKLDEKTYKRTLEDVFPLLSAVAHARDSLIPIHCTHSSVCLANRLLVRDLGDLGRNIGIRITDAIVKLLAKLTKDERAEQVRMVSKAGKMGRNGRNCLKVFPTCHRLKLLPTYNIPSILENHEDK